MTLKTEANAPLPKGLPSALRPWSQAFQEMPETHLRLIGDLMGQLNALLQETFEIDVQSYGEFNGYDGMAMRGEIERLLPSEWLWKELAPVEFLRRFAEQELLYHRPSFESPTDERTHLVVIDCGPAMLGRPRLVALAALLCLNAIARAQGAKLIWTAPHADVAGWQPMLRQEDLKAFLLSANPVSLGASQLEDMVQSLPAGRGDAELVLWTVGAASLAPDTAALKTNQIVISEKMIMSPDGQPAAQARIGLRSYFGRRKETVFTFPKEEDCVSLLREPFRPLPAGARAAKPKPQTGDAARWVPQEVTLVPDINRLILRVRDGILGLRMGQDGALSDPVFVRIKSFDNLLGLRWTEGKILLALTRKYNTFSTLKIRRHEIDPKAGHVLGDIPEIRLEQDDPVVINKHVRNALPPLIKPGRKFRMIALTSKGEQYVVEKLKAAPHAHLPLLPLIGFRDDWGFTFWDAGPRRLLIARNLATSQCVTFALPPNAAIRDINDFVYSDSPLGSSFLLTRCEDGHWRGQTGKAGFLPLEQFSAEFVDVDLSALGHVVPIGQRGFAGHSVYYIWFCSLDDASVHHCELTQQGEVNIKPVKAVGLPTRRPDDPDKPDARRMRLLLCGGYTISWRTDDQGYVTSIDGGHLVDLWPQKLRSHKIAELIGMAKCLSD